MTKQEIEMKREYLIANVSEQITQIRNILYIFGDIPEIADNVDANILINEMLYRMSFLKKALAAFKCQPDNFIEGYDEKIYLNTTQDKIFFILLNIIITLLKLLCAIGIMNLNLCLNL